MRRFLGTAILGALLALALWGQARAQAAWVVTPGVGVGPIRLGMTSAAIEKLVTRSSRTDHQLVSGRPKWIYYNEGLQVHYDDSAKALQVVADKVGLKTPEGVQVGDPASRIEAAYGKDYLSHQLPTAARMPKQYVYVYRSKGVEFQTEGDKILFIYVFPAK